MFRTLLSILDNPHYEDVFSRKIYTSFPFKNSSTSFEEEGDSYIKVINLPDGMKHNNVNVEYDEDDRTLTVELTDSTEYSSYSSKFTETLPSDADVDTISARVDSNVLTIVIDKLPEPEINEDCEEETNVVNEPIIIDVKRKKK
jgi:HSP20 family molecular chaperone IbpA